MISLKQQLYYAGAEPDAFTRVKPELDENNRKNLKVFSTVSIVTFIIMTLTSFFSVNTAPVRIVYIISALVCVLLYLISKFSKNKPKLIYTGVYCFVIFLFAFGIIMGTVISPQEMTVSYAVLIFAAPLVFTDIPIRMNSAVIASLIVYCAVAVNTQTTERFISNLTNLLPYSILSIIVSTYLMEIKTERLVLANENKFLSESDQLTGLLNRRSYDKHLQRLQNNNDDIFLICSFDVNGLKTANDTIGHKAGDELIQGASECIVRLFGKYGKCYRVGGDEFIAIIEGDSPSPEELIKMLKEDTSKWKGTLVKELSISAGIVSSASGLTLEGMLHKADLAMYADKSEYYRQTGKDRRGSERRKDNSETE